jgi:hypothetical protein
MTKLAMLAVMMTTACGSTSTAGPIAERAPAIDVHPVADLCVTRGEIAERSITQPTVRAFAPTAGGDAAQLTFTFGGDADTSRALANGQARRQLGLKLRAADGCNVIYVMWRLDPKPKLDVSVKRNPGMRTHAECGADGYTKVKPTSRAAHVPELVAGATHTLRAEIVGDELTAWIDGKATWHGTLPVEARDLAGPAGLRTDNLRLDRVELAVASGAGHPPACKRHDQEE